MNAQIRYGLACLVASVLLFAIVTPIEANLGDVPKAVQLLGALAILALVACFVGGLVLLIVGLVRRPRAVQPRRD